MESSTGSINAVWFQYLTVFNRQEADVSLSRNTVADWVCEMATDLKTESIEKGKDLFPYSLVDETTDTTGTAHLVIFLRGVDSNLFIMEEILDIKLIHGTTAGKDLFEKICQCVTDIKLPWDKLVGLTTDGALAMYSKKSGLVGRIRLKMQGENCAANKHFSTDSFQYHTEALFGNNFKYKMKHIEDTTRSANHRD
ncbi:general transcription factor II-I repeat domain-containing protein 2A-like [Octopus sinensis]|uniref:General transcription factor II-I repeat domain-containing protein 2A-like n=1 Tax=Octopus sinensis TaxID=2607531 RepID=A0A6P7SG47_9MOLL|nr:general transcription factor II-I repeat domain-containing protein 2A-like [Octopus sinensis]